VEGIKEDYTRLDVTPAERAIVEGLRRQGFDDRDILDIIYVVCLYNFNDRMADATGITGEDFLK
jgi:alkylhydroperoxidase family enzyme